MGNTTRIEDIANEVMQDYMSRILLENYKVDVSSCDEPIECLVKKHMNLNGARAQALIKALSFKNMGDYDKEYNRLHALNQIDTTNTLATPIKAAFLAESAEDFEDAVIDITAPFRLIAQESEISTMAFIYAFLAGKAEAGKKYFPEDDILNPPPGSDLHELREEILSILDKKGYRQEWETLVAQIRTPALPATDQAPSAP